MTPADERAPDPGLTVMAGAARTLTWLNGGAALLLAAFSLGIVGGNVEPPDLRMPLGAFLAGLALGALTALLRELAVRLAVRRGIVPRRGRMFWPVMVLLVSCYLGALLAFGAGTWMATVTPVDENLDSDPAVATTV